MDIANQNAPAKAPKLGIRQPAPDGRLHPICSACRWSMPLDERYDQVRCCNDDSEDAWGDVEANHTCLLFTP